jgi:hypothetical protein
MSAAVEPMRGLSADHKAMALWADAVSVSQMATDPPPDLADDAARRLWGGKVRWGALVDALEGETAALRHAARRGGRMALGELAEAEARCEAKVF